MLLEISTTHTPATDLGYLLHKHPDRVQEFATSFGSARVFYPEASVERCTCALLLDVDPIGLVRRRDGGWALGQYVNDRPYAASSFISVAISKVFSSALRGRCDSRPDLAQAPIPLEAYLPTLPCRGGEDLLRSIFEPLGYVVESTAIARDPEVPEWGESRYRSVRLTGEQRLSDLLAHLYVLIPVLDDEKHYWVDEAEIEKLMKRGGDWLASHPERDLIVNRYLKHQRRLARQAIDQLSEGEGAAEEEEAAAPEAEIEKPLRLVDQRLDTTMEVLRRTGARSVVDLGCGEGKLLRLLLGEREVSRILGFDVSPTVLAHAKRRLRLDEKPRAVAERLELIQGSVTYRDKRLEGYDAICALEVIEHLDPQRLGAFERVVFEYARPTTVLMTTPNAEYNVVWESLPAGKMRHPDHRFEWTRSELSGWADGVAERHGYEVRFEPVGEVDDTVGPPTQMAAFTKLGAS